MAADGPPPRPELIAIGEILGAHGLRGEVKLRSFARHPASIAELPLRTNDGQLVRIAALRSAGAHPDLFVVRLAGVSGREAAERLSGLRLSVPRAALAGGLAEDEFLHADLIGCHVVLAGTAPAETIGQVVAVQNFGAGDLIEIALPDRRATEFVPFTREFVPLVDVEARHIALATDPRSARAGRKPSGSRAGKV